MIKPTQLGEDVTEEIRELRRTELGLSQSKFAAILGVTITTISAWETGLNKPSAEHYIRMGNVAGPRSAGFFYRKAGIDMQRIEQVITAEKGSKSTREKSQRRSGPLSEGS